MTDLTDYPWPFVPYDKIPVALELTEEEWRIASGVPWTVTEKIHGAHMVLVTDGRTVRVAKRRGWLEPGEAFFGCGPLVLRIVDSVVRMHRRLGVGDRFLAVHGELCGGWYPEDRTISSVARSLHWYNRVRPYRWGGRGESGQVQTGVVYSTVHEFFVLDAAAISSDGVRDWIDGDDLRAAAEDASLRVVPVLFRGPVGEALAKAVDVVASAPDSVIPALFGLTALPQGTNPAEGVVCKQVSQVVLPGGRRFRPATKRKHHEFDEDEAFHGAQATRSEPWASPLAELLAVAAAATDEMRLWSAESKVGRVELGDARATARLAEEMLLDVREVVSERRRAQVARLAPADVAALDAAIRRGVAELVEIYVAVRADGGA